MIPPTAICAGEWPLPSAPRPIVVIGAGGICATRICPCTRGSASQSPASSTSIWLPPASARRQAASHASSHRSTMRSSPPGAVFGDRSTAAARRQHPRTPAGAARPISDAKPMGRDLDDTPRVRAICRERKLVAAVNFSCSSRRTCLALRDALVRGVLGDVTDVEVRLNLHAVEYWAFLEACRGSEVLMHSIHYIDLVDR